MQKCNNANKSKKQRSENVTIRKCKEKEKYNNAKKQRSENVTLRKCNNIETRRHVKVALWRIIEFLDFDHKKEIYDTDRMRKDDTFYVACFCPSSGVFSLFCS